jgi:hypothetical protein
VQFLRYRYPLLVGSLAEHVARVGRLPLVDALGVSGPPTAEAASAVRARDLLARTSVRDGMSFDEPVLLVDDGTDAVGGHGCVGAAGRSRREPGDAASRPPAPLSATCGEESDSSVQVAGPGHAGQAAYILRHCGQLQVTQHALATAAVAYST